MSAGSISGYTPSPQFTGAGVQGQQGKDPQKILMAQQIKQENPGITDATIQAGPAAVAQWQANQQGKSQFGSSNLSQSNVLPSSSSGFSIMA